MNFLELVQEVDKLALIQGSVDSVNPTGGFQTAMVGAVQRANTDINLFRRDWLFNYEMIQVPLDELTNSYTPTNVRYWESVYYDNTRLKEFTYSRYLQRDWTTSPSAPSHYTEAPDKSLIFNSSDQAYIANAHAYLLPDTLEENTDVSRIPVEYHLLIVYKALVILGSSVYLGNLMGEYTQSYNEMMGQMMRDYVPTRDAVRRPLI